LWDSSMFATAVYGVLDTGTRRLRLACAGHPPPLLYRPGAPRIGAVPVDAVLPLLLMDIDQVPTVDLQLQAGDRLLFYTDGVTERLSPSGAMYDGDRLAAALERSGSQSPASIVAHLTADVEAFAGGLEAEDDLTLLVLGLA
jgi:sigma-B regulation protein RsbU (phosphoserine phosphatase)